MSSKVIYHLKQQTPMWHFQSREKAGTQQGATLRGSDVKPRLDRFLIVQMESEKKCWNDFTLSPDHDALNYKVEITAKGRSVEKNMGSKAFFANMGQNVDRELTVFYPEGVDLKIICFIPALMEEIQNHIQAFFLIHNFGTRQDKGFGSFVIDKKDGQDVSADTKEIEMLKKYAVTYKYTLYKIDTSQCSDANILDNAYVLYQWMKSGINFGRTCKKALLTEYMLKNRIGGEKRWMKTKGIAPTVKTGPNRTKIKDNNPPQGTVGGYRYIRAVLGVSGKQSWFTARQAKQTDRRGNPVYEKEDITVSSTEIERFQSPITIKVINDQLFFIAFDLAPFKELFIKDFRFENSVTKAGDSLKTPPNFNIKNFMEYCIQATRTEPVFSIGRNNYKFQINQL